MSSRPTASSTASLIAMPRLPGLSGVAARIARPAFVVSLGLATTFAPYSCIIERRYGFCSYDTFTMYTFSSRPKKLHAIASAVPHWPAPVSVVMRLAPSCLL